jgi:sugar phosphate permease
VAIRFALYGFMGPFAAVLMEKYGLRRIICSALLLIACGMLLSTRVAKLWQLVVLWGFVVGIGSGLTALVLGATVANRWFQSRRGLVLGVLTASAATGQLIFLPLASALIARFGWRVAMAPVTVACVVIAGLALLLIVERPLIVGMEAYGAEREDSELGASSRQYGPMEPLKALSSASKDRSFWVLFFTFFVCGLSTSGLIQTHFISFCGDNGLSIVPAASVLAMMGAFDFVGTIGSGWLSDRYDSRGLLFWYYGLRA